MNENIPTWITVLVSVLGTGGFAWLLNVYNARNKFKLDASKSETDNEIARNKHTSELRKSEVDQAFAMYKDMLDGIKKDFVKLQIDMDALEVEYLKAREELATAKSDIRNLIKENEYLRGQVDRISGLNPIVKPV